MVGTGQHILLGKVLLTPPASHFGVWNEYLGRGRTRCGSDDPADFLSPTSSPVLALHPKYDSVQRLECVEKGWDRARRNGFDKLEIHIYPEKDVTHAWHTENRKKNYRYNQVVLNDSTERTDTFFRRFMK
jgi:dienelactone hydrolase